MLKDVVLYCGGNSFIEKQMQKLKVNALLKKCENLKANIKKAGKIEKEDRNVNIIIPNDTVARGNNIYVMTKGRNKDGSIKPIKKYTIVNKALVEDNKDINSEVAVLDLYERSIYLYNSSKDDKYVQGYIIKAESSNSYNYNLVFTKEKVKVLLKNTNAIYEYSSVDNFIEKHYM
jgi:hypothetical protein